MPDRVLCFGKPPPTVIPGMPSFSELVANLGAPDIELPAKLNNAEGAPADWGILLNAELGDCTIAAFYHAVQLWSMHAGNPFPRFSDTLIRGVWLDRVGRRYDPNLPNDAPGNDPAKIGVSEALFLAYAHDPGVPLTDDLKTRTKVRETVKLDHSSSREIMRAIRDCGVALVGFKVPRLWEDPHRRWPDVWDVSEGMAVGDEGHAVILTGWDPDGYDLISWGRPYRMSYRFAQQLLDEAYAVHDPIWTAATGRSLFGS